MIETIGNFFDLNSALIYFVYGQVFFILGLAIVLQSRRQSRLGLARSLRWLGAFGITHGLHEWGSFFLPIQATYLDIGILSVLQLLRVLLLGISFFFLFQFGAELLSERRPFLITIPIIVTSIIFVLFIVMAFEGDRDLGPWQQQTTIWIRYLIGFPGALTAAFGLRFHAQQHIKPLNLTHIYRMLQISGVTLIIYAFLTGLIGPYGNFFPANWLNESTTVQYLGIPMPVFRSMAGLVLAITIIRALEVFDLELDQRLEALEIEQILVAERDRIGRELHDGAIQQVYTAGLIIESAGRKLEEDSQVAQRLNRAMTVLNQAISGLRAYMNELRQEPTAVSLLTGLEQQADDPRFKSLMNIHLTADFSPDLTLEPVEITHILAIISEALSNAARHGQAREVELGGKLENGRLELTVKDNGRGFDMANDSGGYGLRNMRDRARLLGGELNIDSTIGRGTQINLLVPLENK